MFEGIHRFGLALLTTLSAQKTETDVALCPPALYLPLVMLRSVSSGATRTALSRALKNNDALTEEERERWALKLRAVFDSEATPLTLQLKARGHRPFATTFLRRAQELYGIEVETDLALPPLQLSTKLVV